MYWLTMLMALSSAALVAGPAKAQEIDPKAQEVIDRSHKTTATYTIYWRVRYGSDFEQTSYSWAATYRDGPKLRVESRDWRAVADCAVGKGTRFFDSVQPDRYSTSDGVAGANCGIEDHSEIRSAEWLGQKQSEYGLVDEVRVIDGDGEYTYLVTADGALVGRKIFFPEDEMTIIAEPMSFERSIPKGDIFSKSSLIRAKTPKRIQSQGNRAE